MIFVDTTVFMYAVGRPHPLRDEARATLRDLVEGHAPLATSAEVLQELCHAYLPVGRIATLDAALRLATDLAVVWPVEASDVTDARMLHDRQPGLAARDLLHLAVCRRRGATGVVTFDRALAAAFDREVDRGLHDRAGQADADHPVNTRWCQSPRSDLSRSSRCRSGCCPRRCSVPSCPGAHGDGDGSADEGGLGC